MKELIKEAEKLYEEIDTIQMLWVASTKDNDEEGIRYAIGRMSVAMCSAMQLLKCFIERKDNIVDLSKVWHKYNSKQEICGDIIARYKDNILVGVHNQCDIDIFLRDNRHLEGKICFSFVKDLLPMGGVNNGISRNR